MGLFSKKDNGKIIKKYLDGSFERIFKDGTKEKVRATKKRVVYDFIRPDGVKGSIWETKDQYLRRHKKFWK